MASLLDFAVQVYEKDNVLTAFKEVQPGTYDFKDTQIEIKSLLKPGFKIATTQIQSGQEVVKYGFPIGKATETIDSGMPVHVHNLESAY